MIDVRELLKSGENLNVECKLASNGLPKSLWETYSAFANTDGGVILLGVRESGKQYCIEGVPDPQKLIAEFWACIHNPNKISVSVLFDRHVYVSKLDDKSIVVIEVPRADRHEQPVYIGSDMFHGTYCRNGDGDFRCTREAVLAMLRDNTDESLDSRIVEDLDISNLNADAIRRYRTIFGNRKPNHVWESLPDNEFLLKIGAAKKDIQNKIRPTRAGVLAFGDYLTITTIYPNYFLDYRETQEVDIRWTDRVCVTDGTWSGNVFDFYFKIIERLTSSIKVPFRLNGVFREDTTFLHVSMREVLANCLVHADYNERLGIVIDKGPQTIVFSNPGLFRLDVRTAISGGISDCRNHTLFHIFNLIQIVEHAGSGLCTIYHYWDMAGLPLPRIEENLELRRTSVSLQYNEYLMAISKKENKLSVVNTEETAQKTEQTAQKTEQTAQKTEQTAQKSEQTAQKTEQTAQKTEQTAQKTEQAAQKNLDSLSMQICELIRDNNDITLDKIADLLGRSRYAISRKMKRLKQDGIITRIGPDKGGRWEINES